jgi:tagatose-1,6-bisphosphate aldolase
MVKAFSRFGDHAFEESIAFKQQLIRALAPQSTAMLLDPVIGAAPSIVSHALPGATGLIVTVEESGYSGPSYARVSRLPLNWNVEKIKKMGASAVKLLIYYNPRSETAAAMQELLLHVSEDCVRCDIPLFLEILTYSTSISGEGISGQERTDILLKSVEELTALGGDILKVEFPTDPKDSLHQWEQACQCVTQASRIPWVLLSAGVDYNVFLSQTEVACRSGASGILAGRAIWKEGLSLDGQERGSFIDQVALERLKSLYEVCSRQARPYAGCLAPMPVPAGWQDDYVGF